MKYCPYCGAALANSTASFCSECGKRMQDSERRKRKNGSVLQMTGKIDQFKKRIAELVNKQKLHTVEKSPQETEDQNPADDGYDGYYDDMKPVDGGKAKEGLDAALIKKVIVVAGAMLVIVSLCVALMYLL